MRLTLIYDQPVIWRIAFPIFSLYEVTALFSLECIVYVISFFLVPAHVYSVLFYGYLGWVIVALKTAPATLLLPVSSEERVTKYLRECGFVKLAGRERWVPPVPRALRWPRNKIDLERSDGTLALRGAANYLRAIASHLRSPRDADPSHDLV
jgi:hypothetical protein